MAFSACRSVLFQRYLHLYCVLRPRSNELAEYDNSLFHLTIYITYAPGRQPGKHRCGRGDEAEKLLDLEFVNNYEPER